MMNKLLPCGFCGNENPHIERDNISGWAVICFNNDCNAAIYLSKRQSAISAWNTRAPQKNADFESIRDPSNMEEIVRQLDHITVTKMRSLPDMRPVGVVMMNKDGKRATIDMGRVTWANHTAYDLDMVDDSRAHI